MAEIDGWKLEGRPERHPRELGSRGVRGVADERKVLCYRVVSRVEDVKERKDDGTYAHKPQNSRALFPLITPSYAFPPTPGTALKTPSHAASKVEPAGAPSPAESPVEGGGGRYCGAV